MSILERLKAAVGTDEPGTRTYECQECGNVFETDAPPHRAACMNCPLEGEKRNVEVVS